MKYLILFISLCAFSRPLHVNEGCPENSTCSKEMGSLLQKWEKLLTGKNVSEINAFIKQNGVYISGFTKSNTPDKGLVITDSSCLDHRKSTPVINHASVFYKFKNNQNPNFIAFYAYTLDEQSGEVTSYPMPRRNIPQLITSEGVVVMLEHEGIYHNLVQDKDSTTINFKTYPYIEMQNIKCDETLIKKFNEDNSQGVYKSSFCKGIWNESTKKYQSFLIGWSC